MQINSIFQRLLKVDSVEKVAICLGLKNFRLIEMVFENLADGAANFCLSRPLSDSESGRANLAAVCAVSLR
jgi:hypothetical protein